MQIAVVTGYDAWQPGRSGCQRASVAGICGSASHADYNTPCDSTRRRGTGSGCPTPGADDPCSCHSTHPTSGSDCQMRAWIYHLLCTLLKRTMTKVRFNAQCEAYEIASPAVFHRVSSSFWDDEVIGQAWVLGCVCTYRQLHAACWALQSCSMLGLARTNAVAQSERCAVKQLLL
jgi:hypothetical protein